jgi:predicted amidohydrolase
MPRILRAAAVQMDAAPAPTAERLSRAADLVAEAAASGVDLIVLPELFNTGYQYDDRNYALAEPITGPTATWMRDQAAAHHVHLAGTFLLLDGDAVFNTALLVAPDGRTWRYDKIFPFGWERAYFREGDRITIADTDLGRLGMMICWDSAHAGLWQRYAGQIDALLVMSCPPKISAAELVLPDGTHATLRDLGLALRTIYTDEEYFPGADMDRQAAWLGTPVIATAGSGRFRSHLPRPRLSLAAYLASRPDLWKHIRNADQVTLETGYDAATKVIDDAGQVVARVESPGDGLTIAEVALADHLPKPTQPQPKMKTARLAYLLVDALTTNLMTGVYRAGLRRQWGARMAPVDPRTRVWAAAVALAGLIGWLLGRIMD